MDLDFLWDTVMDKIYAFWATELKNIILISFQFKQKKG